MDLRSGIVSTANALGISPLDLATAISYETAGTFDPTKAGPTTQWGQHRGLIQFGEPQARQYGVDWNDPVGSQLGPDGAVARYLRSTGVQPGMGLLDIYSAINAGGVGRYNRSDANNGGAPGTVRDKVEQQMSGHRAKAADLLGGDYTPVMAGGEGNDTLGTTMATPSQPRLGLLDVFRGDTSFRELLGSGDWRDRAILALEGNTLNPNLGLMAQAQGNIANRREDQKTQQAAAQEAQQRNRTAEWLRANGHGQLADLLLSGGVSARDVLGMIQQPGSPGTKVVGNALVNEQTGEVIYQSPQSAEAPTSAEAEIQRIMELGYSREDAIRFKDLYTVSRHPVSGEVQIVDKATGKPVGVQPQPPTPDLPPAADAPIDPGNVEGALGGRGVVNNIANTILDAVGLPMAAPEANRATEALGNLSTRTMLALSGEWAGRPSNLTREKIEEMTVKPNELTMGREKATERFNQMMGLINTAITQTQSIIAGGNNYTPQQKAEAQKKQTELLNIWRDYDAIVKSLAGGGEGTGRTSSGITFKVLD